MALKWKDFPDHWVADGKLDGEDGTYRTMDNEDGAILDFFPEGRALKPPVFVGWYQTHELAMADAEAKSKEKARK